MKNRILFLFLLSIFTYGSAAAQQRTSTVTGTVVDETGAPMVGALIVADSTISAVSGAGGKFTLLRIPRTNVAFKVSFMGYETHKQTFLVGGANFSIGTVRLNPSPVELGNVEVRGIAPMARQRGDTVQYNASSFKVNPDADASDLVSKMPGISIENGTVSSQGENVSRVYVDGKLLFGDSPMDALNNLPADLIEGVQVFDEKTDEAKFSGFDDGQRNRAMNIVTRQKSKRTTTAEFNGGYGTPLNDGNDEFKNRFRVRGTVNSFTETNRISLFANTANISDRAWQTNRSGLFTERNGGVGIYNKWKNNLELTLNYRYQDRQDVVERKTIQDWFATQQFDTRIYNEERLDSDIEKSHSANARLEWKINSKNRILFRPNVNFKNDDEFQRLLASNIVNDSINSRTNNITNSSGDDFSTGGSFLYTHVFSKPGRTINTDINYRIGNASSNASLIDDDSESTTNRNLNRINDSWNKSMTARLSYSEPLDSIQRLEFSYSFRVEDVKAERSVLDFLADPEVGLLDPTLSNFFSRNYFAHTGGLGYALNKPKTKLTAGVNFRNTRLFKDQTFPGVEKQARSFYTWEPRAQLRRDITNTKNLTINYNSNTNVPSVDQFQRVVNTSNLIQLSAGNPNLKPSVSHNLNVRYQASNTENLSTYFLFLSANMEQNRIGNRTEFFTEETILSDYFDFVAPKGSQLTTPVNVNGFFRGRLNGGYSFPVKKLSLKVNLGLSYEFLRNPSYVGMDLNYANNNNVGLMMGFESNISQNVDFSIRSNTRYGYVRNSAKVNSNFLNQNLMGRVNIIFLGGFVFNTDLSYNYQRNESKSVFTQDFLMWNAGLGRKFLHRRNAEVRLTVYDILKQNKNLIHTVGDQYVQDQWNNIIGRYAMLTFNYRFNSLNNASRADANRAANDSFDGGQRRQGPPQGFEGGGRPMGPPPGGGGGRGF